MSWNRARRSFAPFVIGPESLFGLVLALSPSVLSPQFAEEFSRPHLVRGERILRLAPAIDSGNAVFLCRESRTHDSRDRRGGRTGMEGAMRWIVLLGSACL